MARSVTVIPARNRQVSGHRTAPQKKIRVAAYCRVSTDQEDQLHSFEAQVDYYTKYINDHENYEMAGIYADATDIIGLKQNPTNGRRFSPIFLCIGHFSE